MVDEFSRFPFAFSLRNIASSSVIECLATLFAIFGSPWFIHFDRAHSSKTSAAKMELGPPKLRATVHRVIVKMSVTTKLCGKPFSACYTQQTAHSLTGNESYHRRSRRSEHSSIPSQRRFPLTASLQTVTAETR